MIKAPLSYLFDQLDAEKVLAFLGLINVISANVSGCLK